MKRTVIGSILHGAYGDLYEQAICLKHFAMTHPGVDLRLFASTSTRLEAFQALDLSFASSFSLWSEIPRHGDIESFFQFQVLDPELREDVLNKLPETIAARFDRSVNHLPWRYLRDNHLIPAPAAYQLPLNATGTAKLQDILRENAVPEPIWDGPVISFLWRYRGTVRGQAISSFGQPAQEDLVTAYSSLFQKLFRETSCHLLVCGMNVITTENNRARLDNKYPAFGLDLPAERVTYLKGLSWPVELEICSRATVCCGNASGFTEALWLKRGKDVILMDAPYHYLAKIAFHRMPMFNLNRPQTLLEAFLSRSAGSYHKRLAPQLG